MEKERKLQDFGILCKHYSTSYRYFVLLCFFLGIITQETEEPKETKAKLLKWKKSVMMCGVQEIGIKSCGDNCSLQGSNWEENFRLKKGEYISKNVRKWLLMLLIGFWEWLNEHLIGIFWPSIGLVQFFLKTEDIPR